MPTPKYPKKQETKDEYIERCMSDKEMQKEAKGRSERYKICLNYYKEGNNK